MTRNNTTTPPTLHIKQPLTIRAITKLAEVCTRANIIVLAIGLTALADTLADGSGKDALPEHILDMLNK